MVKRILLLILLIIASPAWAQKFQADSQVNVFSQIITASNTPVVISSRPATLYAIDIFNITASNVFIKLYNASSQTACNTSTPVARYGLPGNVSGANFSQEMANGVAFSNGLVMCTVGGITDGNNVAPGGASGLVNIYWHLLAQ